MRKLKKVSAAGKKLLLSVAKVPKKKLVVSFLSFMLAAVLLLGSVNVRATAVAGPSLTLLEWIAVNAESLSTFFAFDSARTMGAEYIGEHGYEEYLELYGDTMTSEDGYTWMLGVEEAGLGLYQFACEADGDSWDYYIVSKHFIKTDNVTYDPVNQCFVCATEGLGSGFVNMSDILNLVIEAHPEVIPELEAYLGVGAGIEGTTTENPGGAISAATYNIMQDALMDCMIDEIEAQRWEQIREKAAELEAHWANYTADNSVMYAFRYDNWTEAMKESYAAHPYYCIYKSDYGHDDISWWIAFYDVPAVFLRHGSGSDALSFKRSTYTDLTLTGTSVDYYTWDPQTGFAYHESMADITAGLLNKNSAHGNMPLWGNLYWSGYAFTTSSYYCVHYFSMIYTNMIAESTSVEGDMVYEFPYTLNPANEAVIEQPMTEEEIAEVVPVVELPVDRVDDPGKVISIPELTTIDNPYDEIGELVGVIEENNGDNDAEAGAGYGSFFNKIIAWLADIWEKICALYLTVAGIVDGVVDGIAGVLDAALAGIEDGIADIVESVLSLGTFAGEYFDNLDDVLVDALSVVVDDIWSTFDEMVVDGLVDTFADAADTFAAPIIDWCTVDWDVVEGNVGPASDALSDKFVGVRGLTETLDGIDTSSKGKVLVDIPVGEVEVGTLCIPDLRIKIDLSRYSDAISWARSFCAALLWISFAGGSLKFFKVSFNID